MTSRSLALRSLGPAIFAVLVCGTLILVAVSVADIAPETYVACGLSENATPSHVCRLTEEDEFGAFFRSPTEATYTVCVEFPTGRELCAETQHAAPETLYVNKITTNIAGLHRVTWSVAGQQVGSWSFRIPVELPVFGQTATLRPVSGTVLIKGPKGTGFVPLTVTSSVRLGTVIDTSRGEVQLESAASPGGETQTGRFHSGVFRIGQTKVRSRFLGGQTGLTVLKLVGKRARCERHPAAASAARGHSKGRHLWGNAHGNFQTGGRYASVTVRGTKWLTEDTCAGTRVKVARGVVSVKDLPHHRTVLVRAPHSFLAHPGPGG